MMISSSQQHKVNRDLAMRGRAGPPLYLAASLVVCVSTGQFANHPFVAWPIFIAIQAASLYRIVLIRTVESGSASPHRWRARYGAAAIASGGAWGIFTAAMSRQGMSELPFLLTIFATSAFALGGATALVPTLGAARIYTLAILLPPLFASAANPDVTGYSTAFMLTIFTIFSLATVRKSHRDYWFVLETNATLQQRSEELNEALIAAEEATRAKSEFLATMSHEIRTPMNGVIGMTDLLLDTSLDAEQRDFAETIKLSGGQLTALINDVLDFSKIEAGRIALEKIPLDPRANVDETLEMLGAQAKHKGIELVHVPAVGVPALMEGDPARLRQILLNLVGNALKFTAVGEIVVRTSWRQETGLTITVTDTGMGMPQEALKTIFEPFRQANSSTSRIYGGTGLGLSIVRRLCEAMGGSISVDSVENVGSTFTVILPLLVLAAPDTTGAPPVFGRVLVMTAHAPTFEAVTAALSRGSAEFRQAGSIEEIAAAESWHPSLVILDARIGNLCSASNLNSSTGVVLGSCTGCDGPKNESCHSRRHVRKPLRAPALIDACVRAIGAGDAVGKERAPKEKRGITHNLGLRVLVAEDNLVNRKVISRALAACGCTCDLVGDGRLALAALATGTYDLVLMDCQMPVMDGFEATAAIRKLPAPLGTIPVIALTANAMTGDRERCLASGMDDYLTKPLGREDLHRALEAVATARVV